MVLVVATVMLIVLIVGSTPDGNAAFNILHLPFLVFWLGALVDARRPAASETATAACRATLKCLAGFLAFSLVTAL
eukprot:SAG31_NODE_6730_length_1908_cov_0.920951_2_plen_76_part_00